MSNKILTVVKKELWSYFSSPTGYIFLGTYLFVSLFAFFWVEKFFSRNIADLRPLFEWMPILLIFLISTLTMRMWSEERRRGTIEFLLTLPVKTHELVLGKFFACLSLVAISLLLTLGLALSVGVLGNIDWGPVIGAYLASLLLAAAYIAIGLYISSKNDSQIVSLISTALICSVFYLLGSDKIVSFLGNYTAELLKLVGSGSRFDSISRGAVDFRDVFYYVSISAAFLVANTFALERLKWSKEKAKVKHKLINVGMTLLVLNILGANLWIHKLNGLRLDLTETKMYSISQVTKDIAQNLEEPLLIRGYFSARTHPLLSPLVPTIRDILREYQLVSDGKIRTEFVDPREDEALEAEANRKYGIQPMPFQIQDRHSASMVNSYFNIIVQYGDKFEKLGFEDLIEVKYDGMGKIDVKLRNLEYDITRRIKKAVQAFKNNDNLFANLSGRVKFVGYISENKLPKELSSLYVDIKKSLEEYQKQSSGKLTVEFLDPSKDSALAQRIHDSYGFKPQALNILARDTFYFYLTIVDDDKVYDLGVPKDLQVESFKTNMDAALKRVVPGFLRTVGIVAPPAGNPMMAQFGGGGGGKQFRVLQKKLEENYSTKSIDLEEGVVPSEIDLLVIVAPSKLNDKQRFAIDQFLMKGGTVVLSTSPVGVKRSQQSFVSEKSESGLEEWLVHNGIEISAKLVGDKKNTGFPSIRKRVVQGITIREPVVSPYPFFVDVRDSGLNSDNIMTSSLGQMTVAWPSPIVINEDKNKDRKTVSLIKSSDNSWARDSIDIEANWGLYPELGFSVPEELSSSTLAVMVEGQFESFYKGKESPLLKADKAHEDKKAKEDSSEEDAFVTSVIEKSSKNARLFVFASNEFMSDETLQMSGMLSGTQYINPVQLAENAIDWSLQDRDLVEIRSRGHFARTLVPLSDGDKHFWEVLNYILAMLGVAFVWAGYRYLKHNSKKKFDALNMA